MSPLPHERQKATVLAAGPAEFFVVQYQDKTKSTQIRIGMRTDKEGGVFLFPAEFAKSGDTATQNFILQIEKVLGKRTNDRVIALEKEVASLKRKLKNME